METTGTVSVAIVGAGGIAAAHIGAARSLGEHVSIGAVIDPHEEAARRTATETGTRADMERPIIPSRIASAIGALSTSGAIRCASSGRVRITNSCG